MAYWHDFDHLNADGATLLSRQLAEELAPLLAARIHTAARASAGRAK
jgi:hypothetical protein